MQRIPEPELMDESEQALAYANADFSEPNQRFVEAFAAEFPGFTRGAVLDLGWGTVVSAAAAGGGAFILRRPGRR